MTGIGLFTHVLLNADDKTLFMPGALTDGHHQLSGSCDSCHTNNFADDSDMQTACLECHGDERKKPFDSHPKSKFSDPRNADLLATIDAVSCITCHTEHKPEITLANGLTRQQDLCFHCHQNIAEDRPSHEGMGFETCASAGCHNFHDNRALYTDFLIKHGDKPMLLEQARVPEKNFAASLDMLIDYPRDRYPVTPLTVNQADAPPQKSSDKTIIQSWVASGHANRGVNCTACHSVETNDDDVADVKPGQWIDSPGMQSCTTCHGMEVKTFSQGKHGMRLSVGLSPMSVSMARRPMHEDAKHRELTCNSCHVAHDYNVVTAAVDSCLECHSDDHSSAYKQSSHYQLWLKEINGTAEAGSGVSCATCHMPRTDMDVDDYNSRVVVNHNQSATLSPNSKMIRPACLECHGLDFSINALSDSTLIQNNFQGQPSEAIQSVPMARALQKAHEEKKSKN